MPVVVRRFLFCCCALVIFANFAFGRGAYQPTKDGKTLVWNNYPNPGDTATWSGYRDSDGYATGFGTLSWYIVQDKKSTQPTLYARYFGRMVGGRFEGPVNVHLNDRTTEHALFMNGRQVTRWAAGRTRSWRIPQLPTKRREPARVARSPTAEPPAPAEGPLAVVAPPEEPLAVIAPPAAKPPEKPPSPRRFADDVDHSLQILAFPPATLRTRAASNALPEEMKKREAPPATTHARLTRDQVIDLSDTQARIHGYNPAQYDRSAPQYDPIDGIWSVSYEQKPAIEASNVAKQFAVAIDDKTNKAEIASAR
jgi:hypothetical protein